MTAAFSVTSDVNFVHLLRLVDSGVTCCGYGSIQRLHKNLIAKPYNSSCPKPFHWFALTCAIYCTVQIDSPAQLANVLVNVTDSDEIESEDVSLTVVLLDTVANSTEDLQEENVSCSYVYIKCMATCYCCYCLCTTYVMMPLAAFHCFVGSNGCPFNCE